MTISRETAEKIRAVEIQGAMNVAKAALAAMSKDIVDFPEEDPQKFMELLSSARPNEPMLRNILSMFIRESRGLAGEAQLMDLASYILEEIEKAEIIRE